MKSSQEAIKSVYKMSDTELMDRYFEIMNYVDSKGIDTLLISEVNAIVCQLVIRDLGLSSFIRDNNTVYYAKNKNQEE